MTDSTRSVRVGLTPATIDIDQSTPQAPAYGDVYFSADGGLAESCHVFIDGNSLHQRLALWHETRPFVIGETGFGTGRNVLTAWQVFAQVAPVSARLHIVSFERHPLAKHDLEALWVKHPELTRYTQRLTKLWPVPLRGTHRLQLDRRVTLDLVLEDIESGLTGFDGQVDAWFLDGFAPVRNPTMWSQSVFHKLAAASRPEATFATYTCARVVRDNAASAGFNWHKRPGAGRKREMLCGQLATDQCTTHISQHRCDRPWYKPAPVIAAGPIAIIGAGIAGATTAEALARRGYSCDIYDPFGGPGGASANAQAALYIRLATDGDIRTRFYLAALTYTQRWLADFDPQRQYWSDCGLLQLARNDHEAARQKRCIEQLGPPAAIVRYIDAETAAHTAAIPLADTVRGALFYPESGWVCPDALCRQLLASSGARIHQTSVNTLQRQDNHWRLSCDNGETGDYAQIILACAHHAGNLSPDLPPLDTARGQISAFATNSMTAFPATVICGRGHVMPVYHNQLHVGASFKPNANDAQPRAEEDQANLDMLAEITPALAQQIGSPTTSRVAFRCTGHNRMPYAGAIPDTQAWRRDYAALALDARRAINIPGAYQAGLWANVAHGANGMVSAPLAAEIIAAQISGEPSPLPINIVDALHPGRWLIRELIRGR